MSDANNYGWTMLPPLHTMPPEVAALWKLGPDGLDEFIMNNPWFVEADDLVGGWCAVPVPYPPSAGNIEIGGFTDEVVARYVVDLHNNNLHDRRKGGEA